ncbi:MAG: porin family protein [Duncaniella sp.]|nr:porin family protein [Duncaniella sp.]
MKHLNHILILFITIVLGLGRGTSAMAQAQAQVEEYKFDIGVGLGMSGYLGDANESNLFKHPGFTANGSFRYLFNTRFALRGMLGMSTLSGSTAHWDNYLPGGAVYDFKSTVYDLSCRFEFNFFNYGIGEGYKQLRRLSPYIAVGVGGTLSSTGGDTFAAFNIPMAFGLKFKLKPRLNLGLEFSMTKVFGDKVDSRELTDLYLIKSSFLKNTDWYSAITLSISYEFGRRCVTCHRID